MTTKDDEENERQDDKSLVFFLWKIVTMIKRNGRVSMRELNPFKKIIIMKVSNPNRNKPLFKKKVVRPVVKPLTKRKNTFSRRKPVIDWRKKTNRIQFFKLHFVWAITAAIILGSLLGATLLFAIKHSKVSTPPQEQNVSLPIIEEKNLNQQFWIIQAGAFKQKESANLSKKDLEAKGIFSYIDNQKDTYYLWIGVAANKEKAQTLADFYQKQGQATFLKEWTLADAKTDFEKKLYPFLTELTDTTATSIPTSSEIKLDDQSFQDLLAIKINSDTDARFQKNISEIQKIVKEGSSPWIAGRIQAQLLQAMTSNNQ